MESVTIEEFEKETQTVKFILILLAAFCIYRIISAWYFNAENTIILTVSIIGYISVYSLSKIAVKKIKDDSFRIPFFQSLILGYVLILGLGSLSCYLLFYKGIYGLYNLLFEFSFRTLIFRLTVFFYALIFAKAISKLHTVFNSIKKGNSIKR